MKRKMVVLILLAVLSGPGVSDAGAKEIDSAVRAPSSDSAITFRLVLRALLQYQVTWTRSYIVSVLSDLEDIDIVKNKLVRNQESIGNVIKPYYGGIAGNRLAALLRENIVIAIEIVRAEKAEDERALKRARDKGRRNAERISDLLSSAKNPLWDKQYLKDMFYKHLEYIDQQVNFRIKRDWASEITAYDEGLRHVLQLADLLAEGIIHQFPDKFK